MLLSPCWLDQGFSEKPPEMSQTLEMGLLMEPGSLQIAQGNIVNGDCTMITK
jgi:hypothetical protein